MVIDIYQKVHPAGKHREGTCTHTLAERRINSKCMKFTICTGTSCELRLLMDRWGSRRTGLLGESWGTPMARSGCLSVYNYSDDDDDEENYGQAFLE